jgi:hypothetical protein
METVLKVWLYLSGKKTVIAAIVKAVADVLTALGYTEIAGGVDQIGNVLLGVGLTHKVGKAVK